MNLIPLNPEPIKHSDQLAHLIAHILGSLSRFRAMDCGHSPTDHGEYIAEMLVETTRATLAKIKGADHE